MEGVDISHLSLEEQNILRNVFARQQDEESREEEVFRKCQDELRLLEAAILLRQKEKRFDLQSTCNICAKTKFADGVGHICQQCEIRCCARCGCKVPLRHNKIWLCILCRKKKELAIKFGKWLKDDTSKKAGWGRSRSLEEEAERRLEFPTGLQRQFTSSLNITTPNLPFWHDEKKDPQKPERPEPLPPSRERVELSPYPTYHHHHQQQQQQSRSELSQYNPNGGGPNQQRRHRRRSSLDTVIRNDSLSSDQSENPPAAARPKPRKGGNGHRHRHEGGSSGSEDDARSTPSSCQDSESETYLGHGHRRHPCYRDSPSRAGLRRPYADLRRQHPWEGGEANTKDSGIDTSSSATLNEDTYRQQQKHNVMWSRSKDGTLYIGHMVLRKDLMPDGRTRQGLGMRVVGDHVVDDSGTVGAIVENIREGSLAQRVARIEPGDEVVEWNGYPFRGRRHEEVQNIIATSKNEPQVQLIISRPCGRNVPNPIEPCDLRRIPPPHLEIHPEAMNRGMFQDRYSHPRFMDSTVSTSGHTACIGGQIEVRMRFDHLHSELHVYVLKARNLPPRPNLEPRSPYCKVALPNKPGEPRIRGRTPYILDTNDPEWGDRGKVPLRNVTLNQIRSRTLQITVWDYIWGQLSGFLGEALICLRNTINNEPHWYDLSMHIDEERVPSLCQSPVDRRGSDEDLSDFDEKFSERTERRMMAIDSSPFYEGGDRQHQRSQSVNLPSPMTRPYDMGVRSRSLNEPSPTSEYPRGRIRETGFEDRRRSRSMADSSGRRTPVHGSRSVSPPHYRHQFQSLPRPSTSQRLIPPGNQYRKRQLPQVPFSRSDIEERYLKGRNSVAAAATPSGAYPEYDRFAQRRGGGSRMAAALGVGSSSPLVSPDRSESESSSKFSLSSAFHKNSRTLGEFTGRSSAYGGPVHPSSRGAEMDGSLSDTAVGLATDNKAMIRRSTPTYSAMSPYLSKKSNSTSQLSVTGNKKRLFFRRRNDSSSSFVVRRSEEVLPDLRTGSSSVSSDGSISGDSTTRCPSLRNDTLTDWHGQDQWATFKKKMHSTGAQDYEELVPDHHQQPIHKYKYLFSHVGKRWGSRLLPEVGEASGFVEGLGPGQLVGRQALASPALGEVQLAICERKNCLEVEVIRARGLMPNPNAKTLPAPYVKVYLLDGRKCIAKRKTATARRTLDPLYQQQILFSEDFRNCILQVTVWGNYSNIERKVFMGVAQIVLDDIDLAKGVINWYKLFHQSSLVSTLTANDRSSFLSLDSFG